MKFKTRKQCSAWCDVANRLGFDVEAVTVRYMNKLTRAGDPRLVALARILWRLQEQYAKGVSNAVKEIRERESEFTK